MEKVVVIKITGKAFNEPGHEILGDYISVFKKLINTGYRLAIVTGGGGLARRYIGYARGLGVENNYVLDIVGIWASRLNALLIASALQPHSYPQPIEDLETLRRITPHYKAYVLGGLIPGQSTAAVALEVAEALGADKVIDMAAIDHVYTADPRRDPSAKPLDKVTSRELRKYMETGTLPGEYQLLDNHAIDIMERSMIRVYITHYRSPWKIIDILEKGENPGTIIEPVKE